MYAAGKKHIPNGSYKGTLIADPFSEAAIDCNFRLKNDVLEYTICIQSGGTIHCFDNPCLSDKVFPAKCSGSSNNAIEVDKAGN